MKDIKEVHELGFHCNLKDICKSCVLYTSPFQCCYQEYILTGKECNFGKCFFTKYCPHANLKSFKIKEKKLLELLKNTPPSVLKSAATSLPVAFVPEVMPIRKEREMAMPIVKDVNIPIIAVSLQNFFHGIRGTRLLRQARDRGLHDFFGFSGKIILTTDVNDRLCDVFSENPNYFKTIVEQFKPEYLTTLDTYTYSNIPACISRIKIFEAMYSSYKLLDLNCKIIGLALGATPGQVYNHIHTLMGIGCRIIAYPVYEFRKGADTYSVKWRVQMAKKLRAKVMLLSCSPGITAPRRVYADYYSSYSWFSSVNSKDNNAYRKRKTKLLRMTSLGKKYSTQTLL